MAGDARADFFDFTLVVGKGYAFSFPEVTAALHDHLYCQEFVQRVDQTGFRRVQALILFDGLGQPGEVAPLRFNLGQRRGFPGGFVNPAGVIPDRNVAGKYFHEVMHRGHLAHFADVQPQAFSDGRRDQGQGE